MSVNINDVGTLKIRPVNHGTKKSDKNGYCGPSVISILTGMTTAESAKVINSFYVKRKRYIKATNMWEISNGFFACGIDMAKIKIPKNIKTLDKWLDDTEYSRKDNIYLVVSSFMFTAVLLASYFSISSENAVLVTLPPTSMNHS